MSVIGAVEGIAIMCFVQKMSLEQYSGENIRNMYTENGGNIYVSWFGIVLLFWIVCSYTYRGFDFFCAILVVCSLTCYGFGCFVLF